MHSDSSGGHSASENGTSDPVVVVESLHKVFGSRPQSALDLLAEGLDKDTIFERTGLTVAVRDVSFEIRPGEIFVLMGLSGSGKSTLLRMVNRLIEPTSGRVTIHDRDVTAMSADELIGLRRGEVSMVFQSFALLPHLRVWENAAFGLDVAGVSEEERRHRALAVLDQVGLRAVAESFPHQLSGGMQQRVGLARSLAGDPRLLLMDEAFSALDPLIRAEMQDELIQLQRHDARTVLFVSHDLDEAMRLGDRIAIMEGGRIVQIGTAEDILKSPADDFVRSFFRGVDPTKVFTARDVARRDPTAILERRGQGVRATLKLLEDADREFGYMSDTEGKLLGVVSVEALRREQATETPQIDRAYLDIPSLPASAPLEDIIGAVRRSPCAAPVVDEDGRLVGMVSKAALLRALDREEAA